MTRSDARNKEVALARIKRLCSSGLPLEPLVRGLFDLINDAVPHSPNRVFHVGDSEQVSAYFGANPNIQALVPLNRSSSSLIRARKLVASDFDTTRIPSECCCRRELSGSKKP